MTAGRSEPLLRIEELAEASGTTVRNIRVYQERGLMPAPIRQGRSALYGPEHRERLTTILRLLDRGYTFATIEELLIAERDGFTLTELLAVDRVRAERRHAGARRRLSRAEAEAIAGFDLSEDMIAMGESIGLKSEPSSSDYFFSDAYMGELFQELILLGMGDEGIERIGTLFMGGQSTAAEAIGVLVDTLRVSGVQDAVIERRVRALLPSVASAARLIFLSAVETLLAERYGFGSR